jgi:predicted CXXCH cytochrome family protein
MNKMMNRKQLLIPLLSGTAVALFCFFCTTVLVFAQDDGEGEEPVVTVITTSECQECHLDISGHWENSPHANAYTNEAFQAKYVELGEPTECLACHTTGFDLSAGSFEEEGVACSSCHGEVTTAHPPEPVPLLADAEYCGECHTTTIGEWHASEHAAADIGCNDCHDPHSQAPLFEDDNTLCLNCHGEDLEGHEDDAHLAEGVGCSDCHALVIPPEVLPDNGIVPTGHSYQIHEDTCVACHTDTLHAGQALDYDHEAAGIDLTPAETEQEAFGLTPEQQVETLSAALANRNVTLLFQGGVLGLVLGGSTAWYVANNVRMRNKTEDEENE